jgi:hypothetical protein
VDPRHFSLLLSFVAVWTEVLHETSSTHNNEIEFTQVESPLSLLRRGFGGVVLINETCIFIVKSREQIQGVRHKMKRMRNAETDKYGKQPLGWNNHANVFKDFKFRQ